MRTHISKRRFILRGALIGLIIGVALFGIGLFLLQKAVVSVASVMQAATSTIKRTDVKNYIGFPLPVEATNFHGMEDALLQSRILHFKFQSSPKILDSFLKQLGLKDSLKEGFNPLPESNSPQNTELSWWDPKDSAHFAGASWAKSETFYDVMVDMTDAESYIVYLGVEQN
ncbi:MAG: hypothetical protein H0X30_19810 [Anaerolineae bacterium]|nr:hypothetical protein [Anaerolineae bacterium]